MNQKTNNIIMVIEQLSDGEFHSGEDLGALLSVSRTAISQYVKSLEELGLDVFRVTGKGYKLSAPIQLLNLATIRQQVLKLGLGADQVQLERVVGSTNDVIKQRIPAGLSNGYTVLAEAQTAGRGRRGKTWMSPFGANLYMSMYWRLEQGMSAAMGLSIALGAVLAEMLDEAGVFDVELKWPNDILVNGRKVAGILIELEGQALGTAHAIVGIGLNLNMPTWLSDKIDQPWADVESLIKATVDRDQWAAELMQQSYKALLEYEANGLTSFITRWQKFDRLAMQPVRIIMGTREIQGIAEGIDENGALLVKRNGQLERYHAGEVSLRYDS